MYLSGNESNFTRNENVPCLVYVIEWFRKQFGIDKHNLILLTYKNLSCLRCKWNLCESWFIPNCTRKIIWLLVNSNIHASQISALNFNFLTVWNYWRALSQSVCWKWRNEKKNYEIKTGCFSSKSTFVQNFNHICSLFNWKWQRKRQLSILAVFWVLKPTNL